MIVLIEYKSQLMKRNKQLLLILCFFYNSLFNFSYGSVVSIHSNESSVISRWKRGLMVSEVVKISLQELKTITGKKINLQERLSFKIVQGRMKRYLKHHPDVLLTDYLQAERSKDRELHFIWFFLIAAILVAGALLISIFNK